MITSHKIKISKLKLTDLELFKIFIKTYKSKNHIFLKSQALFDWQHREKKNYHYMVAKLSKNIIGAHGIIPLNHFDGDLREDEIFLANWRIAEGKGIGIGLRILQQIISDYSPKLIVALPVITSVQKFYETQGFELGALDHYVFLSTDTQHFNIAKIPNNIRITKSNAISNYTHTSLTINDLKRMKTKQLYKYQQPLKSDDYLINRYLMHPIYDYELIAIHKSETVEALFVFRKVSYQGSVIFSIIDFIGPSHKFPIIRPYLDTLIKKNNAEFVDIYCYGISHKYLERAGFINRKAYKGLIIPNYFEPFLKENIDIDCVFKKTKNDPPLRVFKGDGDADRPGLLNPI